MRFHISANLSNKPKTSKAKPLLHIEEEAKEFPKWVIKLKKYNITTEMIETDLMKKYDAIYISETLKYCENYFNQSQVKNKTGYILKALEKGYFKEQIQSDKQKSKHKNGNQQKIEELEKTKKAFSSHIIAIAKKRHKELSEEDKKSLKQEFDTSLAKNTFFTKVYQQKGINHPVIESQRNVFLQKNLLSEDELNIDNFNK